MRIIGFLIASLLAVSNAHAADPGETPLPAAPTGAPLSNYSPSEPYGPIASNLLARPETDQVVDGLRIQIFSLLIGPGKTSAPIALNSPANLVVLSGTGRVSYQTAANVIQRDLVPGTNWFLSPGQAFMVENDAAAQIDIKVTLIGPAT